MPLYSWIIIIVVLVFLAIFFLAFITDDIVSNNTYGRRGDGSISIKYSYPSNYPDLEVSKSFFLNNKKARLYVYEYVPRGKEIKANILFAHGIGSGHFYSLPLIHHIVQNGYRVIAYDQYASGTSEGRKIRSMTQAAIDVKYAVKYVEQKYPNDRFYAMGHSWGGYTASQALRYSKRIEKCINIAGLDSEAMMAKMMFKHGAILSHIMRLCSATHYGKYAFYSTYGIFKKTHAKVLYLQGLEDKVVLPKYSGFLYQNKLKNRPNITVKMLENKGHSPYVTLESQRKQENVMKQFGMLGGVLVDLSIYVDYVKNSVPDPEVYKIIVDYLDN